MSLLIAFCFSMNVMASTGTIQELERSFDNYHYALSVEWDQKDKAFYEKKTNEFMTELKDLIAKKGVSQEEIIKLAEKKINNKAAIEALKLKLSLVGNVSSPEELMKIFRETSADFYNQGASWNGRVLIPAAIVLVVIVGLGVAMWWSATHECSEYETRSKCTTQTTCHGTVPNVSCRDEQICFDSDVCTDYAYTGPHL